MYMYERYIQYMYSTCITSSVHCVMTMNTVERPDIFLGNLGPAIFVPCRGGCSFFENCFSFTLLGKCPL